MKLEDYRNAIDSIDTEILALLNRRADLSRQIGLIKAKAGLPVADLEREESVKRRIVRDNPGDIGDLALITIYREIFDESRRIQSEVAFESARAGEQSR